MAGNWMVAKIKFGGIVKNKNAPSKFLEALDQLMKNVFTRMLM